ncbi:MAG: cell division protein FtsZ [Bacilli bacterium]|jgi:cell division protein FtsZ
MVELDNFEPVAKIVVIGVGGAGNNAVNRMIDDQIDSVTFWVANTDKQALATSKARNRLVLGEEITHGLGAGGEPSVGAQAAEASREEIEKIVEGADLVFIAAGMGGGTGTGASPIIASIAKKAGALTIAIVTRPFTFEGKKRIANSVEGLNNLRDVVDSIIVVSNDKLLMVSGNNPIGDAFSESDKVLAQSVKTVVDLILMPAVINLDYADVKNTLKDSGVALIGFGMGTGKDKAKKAAQSAINSPLLEASMKGAKKAIVHVTCGTNVSLYEAQDTVNSIIETSGNNIDIKFGVSINELLEDAILVSVIASDFEEEIDFQAVPTPQTFVRPQPTTTFSSDEADEESETREEEKENEFNILPDFLKNTLESDDNH